MPACHGAALRVQRQHPRPLCGRRTPSAWLRPAAQAQPGEGLHSAAGRQVRRRLVLRAPVPRGRRLRRTWSSRLRHGAGSTLGTCTAMAQVPLILNRLLKEYCQKNLFYFAASNFFLADSSDFFKKKLVYCRKQTA